MAVITMYLFKLRLLACQVRQLEEWVNAADGPEKDRQIDYYLCAISFKANSILEQRLKVKNNDITDKSINS